MCKNILLLAWQGVLRKKRSSILIFVVLLISFSFAIVALSLLDSISKTNAEFRLNTYGEWYFAIPSGMEKDAQWLEQQPWADTVGTACNYGTVITPSGQAAFGTLDSSFLDIGRITLDSGSFPSQDHEIAMEADTLSSLGYDYTLGQQITFSVEIPYKDTPVTIEKSYVLCGVIHEYSNLWVLKRNQDNRLPVSAVVTEQAAQQVLEEAKECITTEENRALVSAVPQYFISVAGANRDAARADLNSWLSSTRTGDFGDWQACENTAAYPGMEIQEYDNFYLYLIAAVTTIAVLSIYIMQMFHEVHRFTILRSIGITRSQMAFLLVSETGILMLPAILLGIPCGAGLTWTALRLMMYSGSVAIQVSIPYNLLLTVIALWAAAVLTARLITFAAAIHTPLTGRMQLQNTRSRQVRQMRNTLILLLLTVFGTVIIFTGVESLRPSYGQKYWSLCPSYVIWKPDMEQTTPNTGNRFTVSRTEADLLAQVPGVLRVDGFGEMEIGLSFSGMEEQTVWIYAIDEEGWTESLDFDGIKEAFHNGDLVLMGIPDTSDSDYLLPDGPIALRVYDTSGTCIAESSTDASVAEIPENAMNRSLAAFSEPYTIFCSEAYLQRLLASMDTGERWDNYIVGEEFGYDRVLVSADLNSDYLSTDIAMTELCAQKGLLLSNRRQEYQALVQENVQTLILLYSSGICIALVTLLILASALSLEAEQEKRRFGILRTIGMSSRQMQSSIFAKAFLRSMSAVIAGWSLYGAYSILKKTQNGRDFADAVSSSVYSFTYYGGTVSKVLVLSGICLILPLAVSLLSKKKIRKGALVL